MERVVAFTSRFPKESGRPRSDQNPARMTGIFTDKDQGSDILVAKEIGRAIFWQGRAASRVREPDERATRSSPTPTAAPVLPSLGKTFVVPISRGAIALVFSTPLLLLVVLPIRGDSRGLRASSAVFWFNPKTPFFGLCGSAKGIAGFEPKRIHQMPQKMRRRNNPRCI